jgi:membrane protein YqaA with SNARE-associated domain
VALTTYYKGIILDYLNMLTGEVKYKNKNRNLENNIEYLKKLFCLIWGNMNLLEYIIALLLFAWLAMIPTAPVTLLVV